MLARDARRFNHKTLDSRGNKGSMKNFEHGHPVCTQDDCVQIMSGRDVMGVTREGESDHGGVTGSAGSREGVFVLSPRAMIIFAITVWTEVVGDRLLACISSPGWSFRSSPLSAAPRTANGARSRLLPAMAPPPASPSRR